jgi:signal transduction histidine kinase
VRTALQVGEVLREAVSMIQSEARIQDVSLRLLVPKDLPRVFGDRIQLQQVVLNLVVNALEAMRAVPAFSRELEIGAERQPDHVRVSVRDSGPGLPAMQRDRIFDAFYTTKSQGMGMGLAISRSIVNGHGGRLWAIANETVGETFYFTFPIAEQPTY